MDFVNIEEVNPKIVRDIRYATTNNFTGQVLYSSPVCFLREGTAKKLDNVQKALESHGLGLKVYDGYRPRSVQWIFWKIMPDDRFVANPAIGSKHNRGAAVDVTLVDRQGNELAMPTPFDDFTEKAYSTCMDLPGEVLANRALLHLIMTQEGFKILPTEWWHFDDSEWESYPLEDISIEALLNA